MSTFWTPSGERPIPRDAPSGPAQPGPPTATGSPIGRDGLGPPDDDLDAGDYDEAQLRAEMQAMQEQLLRTPAAVVIANHGIAMLELAAIHLGQDPPGLADASVAIDALAGLIDAVGPRMGENEAPLRQALHQLRMAFLEAKAGTAPAP